MQEVERENPPADRTDLPDSEVIRVEGLRRVELPESEAVGIETGRRPGIAERRSVQRTYRHLYRLMALTDVLSVAAALVISYVVLGKNFAALRFVLPLALTPLFVLGFFAAFRLYEVHRFAPAEEFRRIILAVSVVLMACVSVVFWFPKPPSRAWIAWSWGLALFFTFLTRRLWHLHLWRARKRGRFSFRTLIVGTDLEAARLGQLMTRPGVGYSLVGFVSTDASEDMSQAEPVIGTTVRIRDVIRQAGAECVFVASSAVGSEEMGRIARASRLEGVDVRMTAILPEVVSSRLSIQPVGGLMALSVRPPGLTGLQSVFKRGFDLAVAGLVALVTLPSWGLIALAIRLTSRGPVLSKQVRVGWRGRSFTMLGFRTTAVRVGSASAESGARNDSDGRRSGSWDEAPVTRVGRWLHRWSLDELPRLVNVIRGDMSLVGPKPPLPEEVREYEDWQFDRLEVRPGITGLWQVSGRDDLSFDEYVRLDLFYIENWSLAYDLFILAKTPRVLFAGRGAP